MNIALIFAEHGTANGQFAAYRAPSFIRSLGELGFAVDIVQLQDGALPTLEGYRRARRRAATRACNATRHRCGLLTGRQIDAVYSFGDVIRLASVWTHVAPICCHLIHVVTTGRESAIGSGAALRRMAWSRAGLRAKEASRHVAGLLGSSCAAIGNHIEAGFFAQVRNSR